MSTIAERVAAGAAFLDEHDPDWWQRIDLPALDLSRERHCVLGQTCPLEVLENYSLREWGVPPDETDPDDRYLAYAHELSGITSDREVIGWAHERGFALIGSPRDADTWLDLTAEWKRVIAERRDGGGVVTALYLALGALALLAAIALAAAIRALVREFRQQARAERQDAESPLVKAALAVIADEAEDDAWWLEDGEQRLPAALAVAHVAGACEQTNSDLWAGWPSGAFRAAMEQGEAAS